MKKQVGHYEKLVNAICMMNNWKVIEQPNVNALGESGTQAWVEDDKGIVLLPTEDNLQAIAYMMADSSKRDDAFRKICENYARFSGMSSLAELELKLVIRGVLA